MVDPSLYKLSLQLVFVTRLGSTTIVLFFLELAGEDCFRHVHVFHFFDVASLGQLNLKQDGRGAWHTGCLENFFV